MRTSGKYSLYFLMAHLFSIQQILSLATTMSQALCYVQQLQNCSPLAIPPKLYWDITIDLLIAKSKGYVS